MSRLQCLQIEPTLHIGYLSQGPLSVDRKVSITTYNEFDVTIVPCRQDKTPLLSIPDKNSIRIPLANVLPEVVPLTETPG
jgi:hypothetical protein